MEIPAQRVLRSLLPQFGKLIRNFCTSKKCRKYKKCKNTKKAKNAKKCKKDIVAGVVVVVVDVIVVVVVAVVDLLDLVLLLQIFFHAKSGGCSLKIDWVMAILVWLKFWWRTDTLTHWLTDWFHRYIVVRYTLINYNVYN